MMTRFALHALYPGALALLIAWSTAVATSAPEAPRPETEASPATRTVERIAAVSVEGVRTIAVEIHRSKPRPDQWPLEMLREDDSVVVSIVDESNPDSRWEMVAFPPIVLRQQGDLSLVSVDAIHADSVVLMNCDSMYRIYCTCIKQFFDADAEKALGQVKFEPLGDSTLLEIDDAIYSVTEHRRFSGNRADAIVARHSPGEPELVSGGERERALSFLPRPRPQCPYLERSPILEGGYLEPSVTPLTRPSCFKPVPSAPSLWIFDFDLYNDDEDLHGIAVQEGDSYRTYLLPQSTPEDFGLYRSRFLETHQIRKQDIGRYTILETIDAYALYANQLWFGKNFYDGEGFIGVGSLGFFDIERRGYKLIKLPEISDWSTSAILVGEGVVWAGLAGHPEGASYSGGLLRYEIETEAVQIYPINKVITDILHYKDAFT